MEEEKREGVNRQYKDRLLNFIFGKEENKEWTLSLFNAINHSDYTDPSLIEFNTLNDVLYMEMKNDTSFIISDLLNLYEHQSSYNPNMPLRMLEYIGKQYSAYITKNNYNKYGSSLIPLPVPKLVVLYNGSRDIEDECILKLSSSFDEKHRDEADVEVTVRMLNINYGRNKELLSACKPLEEYSWFIQRIRDYTSSKEDIPAAIERAIKDMPEDFVTRDFLLSNRAEVVGMLDTEYNEEEIRRLFMEDGRREERQNTERERQRADAESERADKAEARIKELEALLAAK